MARGSEIRPSSRPPRVGWQRRKTGIQGPLDAWGDHLRQIAGVLVVLWLALLAQSIWALRDFGLQPRRLEGLLGIVTMPLLHRDVAHLLGNSVPLLVLMVLLRSVTRSVWRTVAGIQGLGATLLWLVGRSGNHIGASLLVFGLIAYLVSFGLFFHKRPITTVVSLLVGFLYGGTLLWGVLPRPQDVPLVSWDGHLCGVAAGVVSAYVAGTRVRRGG